MLLVRTKTRTVECKKQVQKLKISDVKNVNKRKNRLTPVKLESKKEDKKKIAPRMRSGWLVSIDRRGRYKWNLQTGSV